MPRRHEQHPVCWQAPLSMGGGCEGTDIDDLETGKESGEVAPAGSVDGNSQCTRSAIRAADDMPAMTASTSAVLSSTVF